MMQRILTLGQSEPTSTSPQKTCWVGVELNALAPFQENGLVVLGRKCNSLAELQIVIDQVRADLDEIVREVHF